VPSDEGLDLVASPRIAALSADDALSRKIGVDEALGAIRIHSGGLIPWR